MTSTNSDPLPLPRDHCATRPRRFSLNLVLRPGEQVVRELEQLIRTHTGINNHLIGVIDDDMRIAVELPGITPHKAELLARKLIRRKFVISLNGRCIDNNGKTVFGIRLYAPVG
jgi:hypothetical protein